MALALYMFLIGGGRHRRVGHIKVESLTRVVFDRWN